jgi:hypothetical protein
VSRAARIPPPGFDALSPAEKHDYVQSLRDSIVDTVDAPPAPDWHDEVVRERLEAHRSVSTRRSPAADARTLQ